MYLFLIDNTHIFTCRNVQPGHPVCYLLTSIVYLLLMSVRRRSTGQRDGGGRVALWMCCASLGIDFTVDIGNRLICLQEIKQKLSFLHVVHICDVTGAPVVSDVVTKWRHTIKFVIMLAIRYFDVVFCVVKTCWKSRQVISLYKPWPLNVYMQIKL